MITRAASTGHIKTRSTGWLTSMAFSPDNSELYVCSYQVAPVFLPRPVPSCGDMRSVGELAVSGRHRYEAQGSRQPCCDVLLGLGTRLLRRPWLLQDRGILVFDGRSLRFRGQLVIGCLDAAGRNTRTGRFRDGRALEGSMDDPEGIVCVDGAICCTRCRHTPLTDAAAARDVHALHSCICQAVRRRKGHHVSTSTTLHQSLGLVAVAPTTVSASVPPLVTCIRSSPGVHPSLLPPTRGDVLPAAFIDAVWWPPSREPHRLLKLAWAAKTAGPGTSQLAPMERYMSVSTGCIPHPTPLPPRFPHALPRRNCVQVPCIACDARSR